MVTTDCPTFYKPPKRLAVVKTDSPTSTSLLHVWRSQDRLPHLLQVSYKLGCGQNGSSKLLQASYTLGGDQNGLSELPYHTLQETKQSLRNSASLLRAWRWSERTVRTSTSFLHAYLWSKRTLRTSASIVHGWRSDSPKFYKFPTR